jgi:hypothetical protein
MAKTYEFKVSRKPLGGGTHSYVATDLATGAEVPLPEGGNQTDTKNLVGSYPEIEAYMLATYGESVRLVYTTGFGDTHVKLPDGGSRWTYLRKAAQLIVIVEEPPRTVLEVTITSQ